MKRLGFTLIELLIVVAIIAILAAIAVPNFLEAQTRARVSRVQNDLRTIALAMESYRVDNNTYAAHYNASPIQPHYTTYATDVRLLTTPISYVASFPKDVFRMVAGMDSVDYRLYSVAYYAPWPVSEDYPAGYKPDFNNFPKIAWMTWSLGPDKLTNTGTYFSEPAVIRNETKTNPPIGVDANGVTIGSSLSYNGMRYDATNGTVSYGDVYRWEGEAKTRAN